MPSLRESLVEEVSQQEKKDNACMQLHMNRPITYKE